jgi:hypothetical protein
MHGLRCAARAARALEKTSDSKWLEDDLREYEAALRRTLAASRAVGPAAGCLPAAPGDGAPWSFAPCVAALYPAAALPADDPLVAATFRYLDTKGVEGLPCGVDGQGAEVDLPLACQYALARLARGEAEAALAAFVGVANTAPRTGPLPERADLRARAGGLMPSAAAAAGYVLLLRELLVREEGEELHLCPCVPREWWMRGVSVSGLPTAFGRLSFEARLDAAARTLVVQPRLEARRGPTALVVHPPIPAGAARPHRAEGWREGSVKVTLGE